MAAAMAGKLVGRLVGRLAGPGGAFSRPLTRLAFPAGPRRAMSGASPVLVELDERAGVAVVRLQQPPVNGLSLALLTELCLALQKLEDHRACRGLVIASAVPGIFSAGLDVTEMCGRSDERLGEFWRAVQQLWILLCGSRLATVAAVNGSSPAGGCLMALSCDYRIMADNPKYSIGLNETRLGIVAPFWLRDSLVKTVGHRAAERSLQLGLLYSPQEALKIGLVDDLVPEEKIQARAAEVMAQWLAIPDHSRQLTKSALRKQALDHLLMHREADIQDFVRFISRDAIQKSLQKYMEMLRQKA
ncbi:enoyl-CoA delta isomerase 1, mitochondrial [Protobothrops mucrosquamatus]|uniref:enoyl-CoA delta isomerase 1, mitochondrial n=1 Tax=Protobothrops mucrosquamatus TaxID=103944 RepID=UPI0007757553|nr:enoyl-CoA delta isomerase 1, mitochondrial [Protobothrops mucrosquamatus]